MTSPARSCTLKTACSSSVTRTEGTGATCGAADSALAAPAPASMPRLSTQPNRAELDAALANDGGWVGCGLLGRCAPMGASQWRRPGMRREVGEVLEVGAPQAHCHTWNPGTLEPRNLGT